MNAAVTDYTTLIAFWLCFTRWTAITFQLPIFDNESIPVQLKVLTSLILSYAFFPFVQGVLIKEVTIIGAENFWFLTIIHAMIGLVIGFFVKSILAIFVAAGSIMTQQIGFASLSYFDPTFVASVGPFEKIIRWTVLIMVLTTGALLPMFKGIVGSFETVNALGLERLGQSHIFYAEFFKSVFKSAFLLATPILFTNLLLNLVMGIVARAIPQMNILMVSFVVNIGIGLLVFFAISEEFFSVAYKLYIEKLGAWFQFFV